MDGYQLQRNLQSITTQLHALQARSDVLTIALQHCILNSANPHILLDGITQRISKESDQRKSSGNLSRVSLEAFEWAAKDILQALEAAPPTTD